MTDFEQLRYKIQEGSATAKEIFIFKMMVDEIVEQEFATPREISRFEAEKIQSSLDSFWQRNNSPKYRPWHINALRLHQRWVAIIVGSGIIVTSLLLYGLYHLKNNRPLGKTETQAPLPSAPRSGTHKTCSVNGPSLHIMPDESEIFIKAGSWIS
ncbi:hypothetical protein, partial [Dawidia soli]